MLLQSLLRNPCLGQLFKPRRPGCGCFKPRFRNRACGCRRRRHNPRLRRNCGCGKPKPFKPFRPLCGCAIRPQLPIRCGCHGGSAFSNFFNNFPCFR